MNCDEIVFKLLELILMAVGVLVAGIAVYFAYQAFKSQSDQLATIKEQREEDRRIFEMTKTEFEANQPTLVQIRMHNCPRFQVGALPDYGDNILTHVIWNGHSTHGQKMRVKASNTISKRNIPEIQKGEKLGPILQNSCLIVSNLNPNADIEQWNIEKLEILEGPSHFTILLGRIEKCNLKIGIDNNLSDALPDTWGFLLMGSKDQDLSEVRVNVRIHFETKTGWQDFHDYELSLGSALCKRIRPPMLPSYNEYSDD